MAALLATRGLGRRSTESTLGATFGLGFSVVVVVELPGGGCITMTVAYPSVGLGVIACRVPR